VTNDTLTFKEVTVGIVDRRNFSEILSGLTGGERIAAAPAPEMAKFKEGMKIRVGK
jgi:hypothetical protein